MKNIKTFIVIFCCIFAFTMAGCATVEKDLLAVENFVAGTVAPDVCAAASYYTTYIQGVTTGVANIPQLKSKVAPYVNQANTLIGTLNSACTTGALASTINNAVSQIDSVVTQINTAVGQGATNTPVTASPLPAS